MSAFFFFFFNDTATTEIYTLSLHDALPICVVGRRPLQAGSARCTMAAMSRPAGSKAPATMAPCCAPDRKSTRLNSSHGYISYAVFCLKKKKTNLTDWHRCGDSTCYE